AVNDQRRRRIRGRRSIRDISAQRPTILRRDAPRFSSGPAQQRKFARQSFLPLHFRVSSQSPERHMLSRHRYAAQFRKIPDIQKFPVWQFSRFQQNHQIRPARDSSPHSRLGRHALKSHRQIPRRFHFVRWQKRSHACVSPARTAATTDSKIFMYPVQRHKFPESPLRIWASLGCGCCANKFTAAKIIPGVQIPHCAPPCVMNACCTACNDPPQATPSIVRIFAPSACKAGTRQLFTSAPSISIAQAPHSPSPHPSFVPVSFNSSRNTSSNRAIGYASRVTAAPFTTHDTRIFRAPSAGMHSLQHFQQRLRSNRNPPHIHASSKSNRIRNRRSCPIQRQFANALRSRRPASIRNFLKINTNHRKVHGSRQHIIRHLRVHHAPFLPHHIFVQRKTN